MNRWHSSTSPALGSAAGAPPHGGVAGRGLIWRTAAGRSCARAGSCSETASGSWVDDLSAARQTSAKSAKGSDWAARAARSPKGPSWRTGAGREVGAHGSHQLGDEREQPSSVRSSRSCRVRPMPAVGDVRHVDRWANAATPPTIDATARRTQSSSAGTVTRGAFGIVPESGVRRSAEQRGERGCATVCCCSSVIVEQRQDEDCCGPVRQRPGDESAYLHGSGEPPVMLTSTPSSA
jgi:hypothetical protein